MDGSAQRAGTPGGGGPTEALAARVMAKRVWQVWRRNHGGVGATVPPLNSAPCGSFLSGKKEEKMFTRIRMHVYLHTIALVHKDTLPGFPR